MSITETATILVHAAIGWALCGSIMAIGRKVSSLQTALILHAIGAPIIFALVSWSYFALFHYTAPLQTAAAFVGFVVLMDALVVAPLVEKSFAMFASALGTWLPFALIFAATYLTGSILAQS